MNDRAREALVAAALNGVKQIRGRLTDTKGGLCALGVLYTASGAAELATIRGHSWPRYCDRMQEWADLTTEENDDIIKANDTRKWDFLTIARKIGNAEESM